jgi:DNA-binding NtrC family response regulator
MTSSRVSSLRLDALVSSAREPAFLLGPDRRIAGVNRAFEELSGHPAEQLIGLACNPHGPSRAGDLVGLGGSLCPPPEVLAGCPAGGTTLIIHAGGERLWRRVEFWPFHDPGGTLLGLFGIVRPPDAAHHAPDSEAQRLRAELLEVRARLERRHGFDTLIGRGPAHRRLLVQMQAAAASGVPVLIIGEPGTGKRTVGRMIHAHGPRRQAPLLHFDAAALPPEILDRELFGARDEDEPSPAGDSESGLARRLELPDGSTLMIGDLLDLPRDLQSRLSSALDGRVRLVAITSGDPDLALKADRLRPDLYYAVTSLVLRLRPLRERVDELPLLAQHLLERANQRGGRQRAGFTPEALETLAGYDWPGNLRELARVVDAAHETGPDDQIRATDLPAAIRGHRAGAYLPPPAPPSASLDEILTRVERRLIEQSLTRARQNKSRAAELLGISRPRLYRRIKELGLPDEPEATEEAASPALGPPSP